MAKKDKVIVVSGCFDPLSGEDLKFLKKCRAKGDWLAVGVHTDLYLMEMQGGFVHNHDTRHEILQNLKCVDEVYWFDDRDGTVCQLLKLVQICWPMANITYISETDMHNMPESKIRGITFEVMK
jgi:bifunctional ADP-heptose synthase (sugar kinase/adenylyltransferase)